MRASAHSAPKLKYCRASQPNTAPAMPSNVCPAGLSIDKVCTRVPYRYDSAPMLECGRASMQQ